MSDSVRPHRQQPTRIPHPWDSPGKNTGVGCHFLLQCIKVKVKVKSLSRVRLLATPWTTAHQAPPSMGFSRQEYWSGVPLPSPDSSYRRCLFHITPLQSPSTVISQFFCISIFSGLSCIDEITWWTMIIFPFSYVFVYLGVTNSLSPRSCLIFCFLSLISSHFVTAVNFFSIWANLPSSKTNLD